MKLGIQILNYNGLKWLPGLLSSLKAADSIDQKIYIVDNGSSDESLTYLETEHPDVSIIRNEANLGYAAAYNRSIPIAFDDGCDWVCLQNTDTLVDKNWLSAMSNAAANDTKLGIMGPVFTEWDSDEPNYYMKGRCADVIPYMFDDRMKPVERDWVEGSVLLINKQCYQDIGGLDPLYFMYWEEADYCRKARYNNWKVAVVPGSVCKHYSGGSVTGESSGFLALRNHLFFKLTNPYQSFHRNIISAARLAVTYIKLAVWDKPDFSRLALTIKAIFSTWNNSCSCYRSWKRNVKNSI